MLDHSRLSPDAPSFADVFAPGLLDPQSETPGALTGPRAKAAVQRYNVYRNNVTVSLIGALAAAFPATQRITGPDFFRAMARSHVRATPPKSQLLFEYGREFPDFIANYEHARQVPWLADVARIERAWLDAYHAADAAPLAADALSRIAPEQLTDIRFAPHPALRIVRSAFPAVSIFAAFRDATPDGPITAQEPEDALITRPDMDVTVRNLPPGAAAFLKSLADNRPLGEAAAAAFDSSPDFDLAANIGGMIEAGAFIAILHGA